MNMMMKIMMEKWKEDLYKKILCIDGSLLLKVSIFNGVIFVKKINRLKLKK